jgi:hypothetical protein
MLPRLAGDIPFPYDRDHDPCNATGPFLPPSAFLLASSQPQHAQSNQHTRCVRRRIHGKGLVIRYCNGIFSTRMHISNPNPELSSPAQRTAKAGKRDDLSRKAPASRKIKKLSRGNLRAVTREEVLNRRTADGDSGKRAGVLRGVGGWRPLLFGLLVLRS